MDVSAQKLSHPSIEEGLKELDDLPDSRGFVDLALSSPDSLDWGTQLVLVFHAWQCGALDLVRFYSSTEKLRLHPWAEQFLSAHFLRQQGYKSESIEAVKILAQECSHEIVQYRAFADSLDQVNLNDAIKTISQAIPKYKGWRQALLTFNLGVATLNKSQFTTAKEMLFLLESKNDLVHKYFTHWLQGQFDSHTGRIESSLKNFKTAITLLSQLHSRQTDKAYIIANAITESLWLGQENETKALLMDLVKTNQNGTGTLPTMRVVAAEAQANAVGGNLALAYKQLLPYFSAESLTRDHLMVGYFYLWLLVFLDRGEEIIITVGLLEAVRDKLGQSDRYFNFEMFGAYGKYLQNNNLKEVEAKILQTYGNVISFNEKFHSTWAKVFLALIQPEPHAKLEAMSDLNEDHWLRRCLLQRFSKNININNPSFWRFFSTHTSDRITNTLSRFKLAQGYKDIEFLFSELKEFSRLQCWGWLQGFDDQEGWIQSGLLRELIKADLIFDVYTGKILNPKSGETLQPLSQVGIFLHALSQSSGQGVSKEKISSLMGNPSYDPLAHDPQIYTLVSRARHWLLKQDADLDILSTAGSWRLTGKGQIVFFKTKNAVRKNRDERQRYDSMEIEHPTLNLRRNWICNQLKENGLITRTEVLKNFPVKKSTVVNDFNFLMNENIIERIGQGRAIYYRLKGAENAVH